MFCTPKYRTTAFSHKEAYARSVGEYYTTRYGFMQTRHRSVRRDSLANSLLSVAHMGVGQWYSEIFGLFSRSFLDAFPVWLYFMTLDSTIFLRPWLVSFRPLSFGSMPLLPRSLNICQTINNKQTPVTIPSRFTKAVLFG